MNTTDVAPLAQSPNYITLIPPTTVFLNVLTDTVDHINITKEVTVLYDSTLSE